MKQTIQEEFYIFYFMLLFSPEDSLTLLSKLGMSMNHDSLRIQTDCQNL